MSIFQKMFLINGEKKLWTFLIYNMFQINFKLQSAQFLPLNLLNPSDIFNDIDSQVNNNNKL